MSAFQFRGERFHVDLSDDEDAPDTIREQQASPHRRQALQVPSLSFVKDVLERAPAKAAVAPSSKSHANGFPVHRKRVVPSRFRSERQTTHRPPEQRSAQQDGHLAMHSHSTDQLKNTEEKREIDEQNKNMLAGLSDAEIQHEREELLQSLSPAMIARLLKRSTIDDPVLSKSWDIPPSTPIPLGGMITSKSIKRETTEEEKENEEEEEEEKGKEGEDEGQEEGAGSEENEKRMPVHRQAVRPKRHIAFAEPDIGATLEAQERSVLTLQVHFPKDPKQPPPLDPSSPNFQTDLHAKYFPTLPSDPSKLAWTQSPSAKASSPYSPNLTNLAISALRFDFTGSLLTPRAALVIPVTAGLHHHGDAPEAAGYTVPELAHLSRSSVPSQRCIAFQTLGRILYRLGKGEWAQADESPHNAGDGRRESGLERGLWTCMREGRVLDTLRAEAVREGGHMSVKAYAVEALWNWRRGGGRDQNDDHNDDEEGQDDDSD